MGIQGRMDLAYIGLAIVAVLIVLTVIWGGERTRSTHKRPRRVFGLRRRHDGSDAL